MGLFSGLFGGSSNSGNSGSDHVSKEDYNYVQGKFREMYDAQQSGDNGKAQKLWDNFKKDTGYEP